MTRLDLPSPAKIRATNFQLQRQQSFNPVRGGHHQAVDHGEPLWTCEIETTPLSRAQGGEWKALFARLRGMARTLMLWDASRPKPVAYHDTTIDAPLGSSTEYEGSCTTICGSAVDEIWGWGAPEVAEVNRADGMIRLINCEPGTTFSPGDMGAWDDGTTRRLHIVTEAVAADEDGEVWLVVEPAPPDTSEALPACFEMYKPRGEFVVIQKDAPYSAPVIHQVKLSAVQVLRRS